MPNCLLDNLRVETEGLDRLHQQTKNPDSIMTAIDTKRKFPSVTAAGGGSAMDLFFFCDFFDYP